MRLVIVFIKEINIIVHAGVLEPQGLCAFSENTHQS